MSIVRYGENGEIIYAPEGGPLKNLWKYMAVINNDTSNEESVKEIPFDYNEFFKRLYLSRAELDVTNSVLQLLLGEGDRNISLEAIHHDNVDESKENISSATSLRLTTEFVKEISRDLRRSSEALGNNRREEHEIISSVLLALREKFRWNLVRISSVDQVQVTLDYQEATPIIGVDYSPLVLFKSPSSREQQYNYNFNIGGDNLNS